MAIIFYGIYWVIMAVLSWFGCPYIVRKKYKNKTWRKEFQRDISLSHTILGVGFIFMGLKNPNYFEQNTVEFCIGLIAIFLVAFLIAFKVRKKYDL